RKLMLLADVRDESTTEVRLVLEPKSRNVEPAMLMESLFRQTDLETRFALNMNVLDASNTPRVMALPEVLQAWLDHRREVPLGRRRTELGEAPSAVIVPLEALVEREPVTVICSDKGWIRAMKGHGADAADLKYKEGDRGRFVIQAETTDKLLVFGTNGRFYTIGVDKLPSARGHGEPLRLMID